MGRVGVGPVIDDQRRLRQVLRREHVLPQFVADPPAAAGGEQVRVVGGVRDPCGNVILGRQPGNTGAMGEIAVGAAAEQIILDLQADNAAFFPGGGPSRRHRDQDRGGDIDAPSHGCPALPWSCHQCTPSLEFRSGVLN